MRQSQILLVLDALADRQRLLAQYLQGLALVALGVENLGDPPMRQGKIPFVLQPLGATSIRIF
jgi:hypothetical protein